MSQKEKDIKELAGEIAQLITAEEFEQAAEKTEDVPLSMRAEVFFAAGERTDLDKWLEYTHHCTEAAMKRNEL